MMRLNLNLIWKRKVAQLARALVQVTKVVSSSLIFPAHAANPTRSNRNQTINSHGRGSLCTIKTVGLSRTNSRRTIHKKFGNDILKRVPRILLWDQHYKSRYFDPYQYRSFSA